MSNRYSTNSGDLHARSGLTLVEVVAGIALLATVLVAVLAAHTKHAAQIRRAQARLIAVESLDALLAEWSAAGSWPSVGSTGENWRVVATDKRVPEDFGCEVIRVEWFDTKNRNVLAHVELLNERPWSNEPLPP